MIIVDRNDSLKDIAGKGLLSAFDMKVVTDVERLLSVMSEKNPEEPVVILDTGEKADTILNISFIKKIKKDSKVYVFSPRKDDTSFAVDTFRAGANDLFFYNGNREVEGYLREIQHGVVKKRLGKTLAFVGSGAGGTFLTVNVAHAIKRLYGEFELCIVDCDGFKNDVALRMGASESQQLYTISDFIAEFYESGNLDIKPSLMANSLSGITVVPAASANFYLSQYSEDEYIKTFTYISTHHDLTIFNMGNCFDSVFRSVLSLSDRLFLVITQDLIPLKAGLNLVHYLRRAAEPDRLEVIVNRHTKERESRLSLDTVRSILGKDVAFVIPEDYRSVSESEFSRRPIQAGDSAGIHAGIEHLAMHIVKSFMKR